MSVFCALAGGAPAYAQSQAEPPAADVVPLVDAVLVVSIDTIKRDSLAGRGIREQTDALRHALRDELDLRREALRAEEKTLAEQRTQLSRDAFAEQVAAFEQKVRSLRRDDQDDGARVQRALTKAHTELRKALVPIFSAIMAQRSAGVMLNRDETGVILYAHSLDVTEEAIKRLDDAVPRIEVRLATDVNE